jgi:hypothetical protein
VVSDDWIVMMLKNYVDCSMPRNKGAIEIDALHLCYQAASTIIPCVTWTRF